MESYIGLLNNAILLLALGVIYDCFNIHQIQNKLHHDLATALLVSLLGIAITSISWQSNSGITVDTRMVLICLCAIYFGRNVTLIAIVILLLNCIYQHSSDLIPSIFMIISSTVIGLSCRTFLNKNQSTVRFIHLFFIGFIIHIVTYISLLLQPISTNSPLFEMIYPIIVLFMPLSTLALGTLLNRQQAKRDYFLELVENKRLLARERALLKSLIDSIPDLIFYKDPQGNYLGCNKAFEKFIGFSEQQLLNKTDYDFFEYDLAKLFRQQDKLALSTPQGSKNEEWATYPDGLEVLFDTFKMPFCDQLNKVEGLVGISRDITQRHNNNKILKHSETRFRHIFENMSHVAVQGYNRKREVIFWNQASTLLYGYTARQALGRKIEELIIPSSHHSYIIETMTQWFDKNEINSEFNPPLIDAHGNPVSIYSSLIMIKGIDDQPEIYCVDIDLRAQKFAEDHADTLSKALEQSPMSVIITDKHGIVEYVNSTFERSSGLCTKEITGQPISRLRSDKIPDYIYDNLVKDVASGKSWQGEMERVKLDGQICWEQVHVSPITDSNHNINHYLVVKNDITQQKEQEQKILYQAHFDSLTGLANRFLALEKLDFMLIQAKRYQEKIAVIFLDFDDFKKVNDTLGHQQGDQLLIEAAQRLKSTVRESDIVGRLGGDEFIILIHLSPDFSAVSLVANKILDQFREPFVLNDREFISTVSIGIATYPDDALTADEILQQADCAMYHSKNSGRNTLTFFTQQMNKEITRRVFIEQQLRLALTNDELYLNFQPFVELPSMKVIAAEALLRWYNPKLGQVEPQEFIHVAEQTGLIIDIGMFSIKKSIAQIAQWRREFNSKFYIAIYVSPRQCRDPHLVDDIKKLLEQYDLPPEAIELEITEGVLISGDSNVEQTLQQFSDAGFSVAMDDFGTGYSSLSYLRKYPFNTLKIDRSFTHNMTDITADLELVSAAILMGHGLKLTVITEGVETPEQLAKLSDLKCDIAQGFHLGRPVSADEFNHLHFGVVRDDSEQA